MSLGYLLFAEHRVALPWQKHSAKNRLDEILTLVQKRYVDSLNLDTIQDKAIGEVLARLDPHSTFLPYSKAQRLNESLEGNFEGIGIEYHPLGDSVMVVTRIFPNGPAAQAGMQQGDRVLSIQGKRLVKADLDREKITGLLKGKKGTHVSVQVYRPAIHQTKNLSITRGRIESSSIDAAYMLNARQGYVKIDRFASSTDTDFRKAVFALKKAGMKSLVLDLRGNGGGYLSAATALADEFLPAKKLIVFTKGAHEPRMDYLATDSGCFEQGNLVVLVDEYSASASEVLAGALQDLDRATIIGRRSFGKGLVQEQFVFDDGSALNLTIARYYTPSGRSIQKSYAKGLADYQNELAKRGEAGELFAENKEPVPAASAMFHTYKGRKVYGGGGITPDVFVAEDTSGRTPLFNELNEQNLLMDFVIGDLTGKTGPYKTLADYVKNYRLSDADFDRFIHQSGRKLKTMPSAEIRRSDALIRKTLKAVLARYRWGDEGLYRVLNEGDAVMAKAVDK